MSSLTSIEQEIVDAMLQRRPELAPCVESILALHAALIRCYDNGGKLLTCGNGGSHADAVHIVGELCKSFERKRTLSPQFVDRVKHHPHGDKLAAHLEQGLAAVTLGCNSALKTAVENDSPLRDIAFAQEVLALAKPGDVVLGISTSGNAANCLMALSTAKACDAVAVSLTGPKGGAMAELADIAIKTPGEKVALIQEFHIVAYHTVCCLIEAHYFPEMRA